MAQEGLDALIVAGKGHWWTGRGYFRYFTDFHLWGHDGLLLIPLEGDPGLTLSSYAVAERIARRGWVTDCRGDVDLVPRMAEMIREKGLTHATIGIAGLRWIIPAGVYDSLRSSLAGVTFVGADDLIDSVRRVKSPLEICQIRELWQVSKASMEHFVEIVEPGRNQRELASEASKVAWTAGARDALIFIGESPDDINPPRDTVVRCDGILRFHMEICGESGHWSEITVTCAYREPSALESKLMESELHAYEAVRRIAKPGVNLKELAQTFETVLGEEGWRVGFPTNHFDFHGQGLDTIETPWFAAAKDWGDTRDRPLEAGTVLSYHPRRDVLPRTAWSTGINEDILITDRGAERLSGEWDLRWRMMGR